MEGKNYKFKKILSFFFLIIVSLKMFSYIKIIDICEQNLTITFHGNNEKLKQIKEILVKDYFETATFIYKNNENESFVIVCKKSNLL